LVSFQLKTPTYDKDKVIRCVAVLTLEDAKGVQSEQKVVYQVKLDSPATVARDPYF
jgi:hypothetical protein